MLITRKCQQKPGSPGSVQENNFPSSSSPEVVTSTESDSEDGESEDEMIEDNASYESPSFSPWASSNASSASQSSSVQQSASNPISFPDRNFQNYTAPVSTMHPAVPVSSTARDFEFSSQGPMLPFPVPHSTPNGTFEPFFGAESAVPLEADWGSYAGTGTTTPCYSSFGTPTSGTALSAQNCAQVMGSDVRSPMRATLILEASSSALSDVLKTLLDTNTKFTIETNH